MKKLLLAIILLSASCNILAYDTRDLLRDQQEQYMREQEFVWMSQQANRGW